MDIDFYTEVDKALEKIPYCSSKCNYYMFCPVCDRTESELSKCSIILLPEKTRRRFVNLYLRGREGLKAEAMENLFLYASKLNLVSGAAEKEDVSKYLEMIMKVDRTFRTDPKIKEIPLVEREELPQIVEVTCSKSAKPKSTMEKIVKKVERELDKNPDSLYNSPIVDEMKARAKIGEFRLPEEKKEVIIDLSGVFNEHAVKLEDDNEDEV